MALNEGLAIFCEIRCATVGDYGGYGTVGEANLRSLREMFPDIVVITSGMFGARSATFTFDPLFFAADESDKEDEERSQWVSLRETIEGLEDYPLLDDEMHWEVEEEWKVEAWNSFQRHDLISTLATKCRKEWREWHDGASGKRARSRARWLAIKASRELERIDEDEIGQYSAPEGEAAIFWDGVLRRWSQECEEKSNTYWETDYNSAYVDEDRLLSRASAREHIERLCEIKTEHEKRLKAVAR
jgi:hypothetical protein